MLSIININFVLIKHVRTNVYIYNVVTHENINLKAQKKTFQMVSSNFVFER